MAERKSGPVRPPIIDAKPRAADKDAAAGSPDPAEEDRKPDPQATGPEPQAAKPEEKAAAPGAGTKESEPSGQAMRPDSAAGDRQAAPERPTPSPAPASPLVATALATGAGAIIGLGLAYGLAALGYWPQQDDQAPAREVLETRMSQIEAGLAERQEAQDTLSARLGTLEADLAALDGAVSTSAQGLAAQADLEALAVQLTELSTRLDAVAAGASGEESAQITARLAALSDEISALAGRLDAMEPQMAELAPVLEDAQARLDDLDARIADQPAFEAVAAERDRVAQLPAALDALEAAIGSGAPFAAELGRLEQLLPQLEVSDTARTVAAGGAAPVPELLARLRAAIPGMLAARPLDPQANWAQTLVGQAAAALALRPTEGDSPNALVGRTEAALEAGDLEAAQAAFSALPEPMRAAAAGLETALANALAARRLLETARATDPDAPAGEEAQ